MGRELGRISGPLLADNLLRNGNDIAFETGLLYLGVANGYIGVNNAQPTKALDILGTTVVPTVIVDTEAKLSNLIFTTNQIQNLFDVINIVPNPTGNPNVVVPGLSTDKLTLKNNVITNYVSGDNLTIAPTGQVVIGTVLANNYVLVNGNLHATGDVTFDGNTVLGSGPTTTISIPAEVNSDIIPTATNLYNLGSSSLKWGTIYSNAMQTGAIANTNIVTGSMNIGTITIVNQDISSVSSGGYSGIYVDNITDEDGNLFIDEDGNLFFTDVSGDAVLRFSTTGTGKINFNNTLTLKAGEITYNQNNPLNFSFASAPGTGAQNGYLKFGGETGFVPPVGTTAQRPLNADIGTMRFNSNLSILEVYANISNTVTSFDAVTNQTVSAGTSVIYTTGTTGMKVGNLVTSASLPGAFSTNTLVSNINPGVSFSISTPLLLQLPSGSQVNALQQWVPSIGLSPVLSLEEVTEVMDIWTLILG